MCYLAYLLGNRTVKLIESCKRVIACEIDPRMAAEVRKRCATGRNNLEVRESDVLKEKWPIFDVCVANLPYQRLDSKYVKGLKRLKEVKLS